MRSKVSSIAAGASILFVGTLTSRVLGWARDKVFMHAYGDSWISNAYYAAFNVPDMLYYLFAGGALSAAFIPVFSAFLSKDKQEDANRIGSSIANLMLLALVVGVIIELIFAPSFVRMVAPKFEMGTEVFNLTVAITRLLCVVVLFQALSALLTGMLNAYHHFTTPAIVFNAYNVGIIIGVTVFRKIPWHGKLVGTDGHTLGIYGVALGVLLGAVLMVIIQIPVVRKHGFRYRPLIDFKHEGVRRILRLFVPMMVGLSASQFNLLSLPVILAGHTFPGALTDIRTATRLIILPLGLFSVAISTAAFPKLAQQVLAGETTQFRETLNKALRTILLLTLPASVAMFILAEPLTFLLWGGGEYGVSGVRAASFALLFLSWGLTGISVMQILNRAFFSLQKMWTPVLVGVGMVILNVPISWYLATSTSLRYGGIALSTSLTMLAAAVVMFLSLRNHVSGLDGRGLLGMIIRLTIASAFMGVVVYFVARGVAPTLTHDGIVEKIIPAFYVSAPFLPDHRSLGGTSLHVPTLGLLIQIMACGIAGILSYLAALWVLRVKELDIITNRVMAKIRRRPATV